MSFLERKTAERKAAAEQRHKTASYSSNAASHGRNPEGHGRNKGGRPPGSRNRPKQLVPTEMANAILLAMKDTLPPDHLEYMKGVMREGKSISTKHELDVLVMLLSRNLMPVLIEETLPKKGEDGKALPAEFRRDVTERLKVLSSMLGLRHQIDKRDEPANGTEPLLQIFAGRGIDPGRIAILIDRASGVVGSPDGARLVTDEARALPDSIPERQVEIQDSEQVSPSGILNGDFWRDDSDGSDEGILQG